MTELRRKFHQQLDEIDAKVIRLFALVTEAVRAATVEVVLRHNELMTEERARSAVRQRMLNEELNHRVKNILAVVQALARMRSTAAPRELSVALKDADPTVRFAAAQALGRFDLFQRPGSVGSAVESSGT